MKKYARCENCTCEKGVKQHEIFLKTTCRSYYMKMTTYYYEIIRYEAEEMVVMKSK